jgi:alkyl hydroperoxide reductase subunit D
MRLPTDRKEPPMPLEILANRLPQPARDLKQNLATIGTSAALNEQQLWGAVYASALAARTASVIRAVAAEAAQQLSPAALDAAKAAHAIMAMNNVYYRSLHMIHDEELRKLPARLRMTVVGNPGVDKLDFELWELAVSAINGCDECLRAHVKGIIGAGGTREQIQEALRIAAIVNAVAVVLEGEEVTSS